MSRRLISVDVAAAVVIAVALLVATPGLAITALLALLLLLICGASVLVDRLPSRRRPARRVRAGADRGRRGGERSRHSHRH